MLRTGGGRHCVSARSTLFRYGLRRRQCANTGRSNLFAGSWGISDRLIIARGSTRRSRRRITTASPPAITNASSPNCCRKATACSTDSGAKYSKSGKLMARPQARLPGPSLDSWLLPSRLERYPNTRYIDICCRPALPEFPPPLESGFLSRTRQPSSRIPECNNHIAPPRYR